MITHCPACGMEILNPQLVTKRHYTLADCLRALLLDEQRRHKKIVEIMQAEIKKRELLELELARLYEARDSD